MDALPRGAYAAIVVGHAVTDTFVVKSDRGLHLPLGQRVRSAVAEAEATFGAAPTEVRLVCVDDGNDGTEIAEVQEWLAVECDAQLLVLDLVARLTQPGSEVDGPPPESHEDAMSVARACEAALW